MRLALRLTARQLKANPGRTWMALLAIILSSAMLTAIVGFVQSAEDAMREQVIAQSGRQHIRITGLSPLQALLVRQHNAVAEAWTAEDSPDTLNIRLTAVFLDDPEAALASAPLAALAMAFSDAQVELNRALIALEAPGAGSPLGEGFVRMTQLLMAVVVVCAMIVIANGFAIALSERTRSIGLLRSAGATSAQVTAQVLWEAVLLASIGIPVGIAVGFLLQWGVLSLVMVILGDLFAQLSGVTLRPALSPRLVWLPGLLTLGTVLVSSLRPAVRAARIAPLQAVYETGEVFLKPRDAHTPRWVRRLFGVEGMLALRTMRRNRRKYATGILSLTAASALFISVASFAAMAQRSVLPDMDTEMPLDAALWLYAPEDEAIKAGDALVRTYAGEEPLKQQALRMEMLLADDIRLHVFLVPLPEEAWLSYTRSLGISPTALADAGEMAAILYAGPDTALPGGVLATARLMAHEAYTQVVPAHETALVELPLLAVSQTAPNPQSRIAPDMQLILPAPAYDRVFTLLTQTLGETMARERMQVIYGLRTKLHAAFAADANAFIEAQVADGHMAYGFVEDVAGDSELAARLILVVKLFVYGFIAMLTLIAITSVVSTLSTGVLLRKRQFALLRSAGMTPQGVARTLRLESVLYAFYTCALGIPLGLLCAFGMHRALGTIGAFQPAWGAAAAIVPASFLISWLTLQGSSRSLITLRIADTLRAL